MSLWGVHIGFAAMVTTLLLVRSEYTRQRRWAIVATSGFWAIIPDLHNFVPGIRPWFRPLFHQSMLANVFWFHRGIDRMDPGDRVEYSAAMWVAFLAVFIAVERRHQRNGSTTPR